MNQYNVCVFDLDGTLINSITDLANSCNEALSLHSLPTHPVNSYNHFVGSGIKNLIKRCMGEKSLDEDLVTDVLKTFNNIYNEKCLENTRPYDGIPQLISDLRDNNVKICILSNKADDFTLRITDALFNEGDLDLVFGKKAEYPIKPAPDSLFAMLEILDCPKEKCLYIGDSDVDVITASNAGVDFCGVEWGFRGVEELVNAGAKVIAKIPNDIFKLVTENE